MFSSIPADAFQHIAREKLDEKKKTEIGKRTKREKKEKGRRCSQDFSDKMEQRRLGLQHRMCWKQEWLLRDQCLLPWWGKCQSTVSPRGRNPAWRGFGWDGMCRSRGQSKSLEKEMHSPCTQVLVAQIFWLFLLCSAFHPVLSFCVSPSLYPRISWAMPAELLSLWVIMPASFQGLLRVTFCTKQGITEPFVSTQVYQHCGKQSLGNSFDFSLVNPELNEGWEILVSNSRLRSHQCSWARGEGNICSSSPCPGEILGTSLWVLGSHNHPCSLRAYTCELQISALLIVPHQH